MIKFSVWFNGEHRFIYAKHKATARRHDASIFRTWALNPQIVIYESEDE